MSHEAAAIMDEEAKQINTVSYLKPITDKPNQHENEHVKIQNWTVSDPKETKDRPKSPRREGNKSANKKIRQNASKQKPRANKHLSSKH